MMRNLNAADETQGPLPSASRSMTQQYMGQSENRGFHWILSLDGYDGDGDDDGYCVYRASHEVMSDCHLCSEENDCYADCQR